MNQRVPLLSCQIFCHSAIMPEYEGAQRLQQLRRLDGYDAMGAGFISHDQSDLANARVAEVKSAGHPVLCWTITSEAEEAIARQMADNITFEGYAAQITP